ncbi:MAG: hypothetical protein ACXADC_15740 [Candidatus Thorarchaeota archaeon]|jgi:hypothetical protein
MATQDDSRSYDWKIHPQAEAFLELRISDFLKQNRAAREISDMMLKETSTRFFDWVDHIVIPNETINVESLDELQFEEAKGIKKPRGTKVYINDGTILFPVLLSPGSHTKVALKPELLGHFLQMTGLYYSWTDNLSALDEQSRPNSDYFGRSLGLYQRALVSDEDQSELWAVERRGFNGYVDPRQHHDREEYLSNYQEFLMRRRHFSNDREGLETLLETVKLFVKGSRKELVADAFFRAERQYWQSRDRGGMVQRALQDRLGLGWGNHDHHTYRSSRENYSILIEIFETMGFVPREQFFTGKEGGWGAQVLEHPICGITIFADVDITEKERDFDFAHEEMTERKDAGTVGLWVSLHGESILQGGMHHLAARVDFDQAEAGLMPYGAMRMQPFSEFKFLRQAFVESERRPVEPARLRRTVDLGHIRPERQGFFEQIGAIGSHLELIERRQGFKGFNQSSVSVIIDATDPRR